MGISEEGLVGPHTHPLTIPAGASMGSAPQAAGEVAIRAFTLGTGLAARRGQPLGDRRGRPRKRKGAERNGTGYHLPCIQVRDCQTQPNLLGLRLVYIHFWMGTFYGHAKF